MEPTRVWATGRSPAGSIGLDCEAGDGMVRVLVRDNGVGIPKEKIGHPRSLGLLGIRERALLLGGNARVRRAGDRGTTVTVRIPLGAPSEGGEEGRTLPEAP